MNPKYRVAIVHDYLNQMGGAERVVELLHRIFPEAPIYTSIVDWDILSPEFKGADIRTTWMQKIPGILKKSKHFFWLYPFAFSSIDLRGYDLVISSSSAYAKGASVKGSTIHICYCHTPMRFAWDFSTYMAAVPLPYFQKVAAKWLMFPLRLWDKVTAAKVHHLIANSSIVQERIKRFYDLRSSLVFPPVNISRFQLSNKQSGDYFLVVSRFVSYKRIDLAVQACTRTGKTLILIGDGPDRKRLESLAGPTVRFLGRLPDEQVVDYMKHCAALIFPGLEDFGITPLEVNACGRPVIAYKGGGALDTIKPGVNGDFFEDQTVECLSEAIESFDRKQWDPVKIRKRAEEFGEDEFIKNMMTHIESMMEQKERNRENRIAVRRFG